jgi:uncharacterized phage infection (PIP) family protein YhgE
MNIILLVAALIVTFLVFTWLVKVVKATVGTAIAIALLILALQLFFGIGPMQVWQQVSQFFQAVWQTITGSR